MGALPTGAVHPASELYEIWRMVARQNADRLALRDAVTGRQWTFAQLARQSEAHRPPAHNGVFYPCGTGPEFVLTLLRGWRAGLAACPLESGGQEPAFPRLPAGCAHLKLTSATTGTPRAVAFSADQLQADARNIIQAMQLSAEWTNLATISLAHSYGFSNLVLLLVFHGLPLILAGRGLPEQLRGAAAGMKDLVLPAVPALWRAWLEANAIPEGVRVAISAGAPLPLALEEEVYRRFGLKIHNFYGSTECGGIAYDASAKPRQEGTMAGEVLPQVEVRVGEEGCLEVAGANVALTYWPRPDPALAHGVFRTRDLARLDGRRVYLLGRAGDVINVAGRKLFPDAVEEVLRQWHGTKECVVFGVPATGGTRGEMVVAAVALKPTAALDDLRRHARERLPMWQVPRDWWVVGDLQANARGKISRAEWAARYLTEHRQGLCPK